MTIGRFWTVDLHDEGGGIRMIDNIEIEKLNYAESDVTEFVSVLNVDANGPTVDQTAAANDAASANFTPFPATEAIGDYVAFGSDTKFNRIVVDYAGGTAGTTGVVAWEFWNGAAWAAVAGLTDGTTGFTAAVGDGKVVSFTMPTTWVKSNLNGVVAYWLRARVTTVYTINPVLDQAFLGGQAIHAVQSRVTSAGAGEYTSYKVQFVYPSVATEMTVPATSKTMAQILADSEAAITAAGFTLSS